MFWPEQSLQMRVTLRQRLLVLSGVHRLPLSIICPRESAQRFSPCGIARKRKSLL